MHALQEPPMTATVANRLSCLIACTAVLGGTTAYAYDLFGSDIAGIDVQSIQQCADACTANSDCLAWTFVRAGLKGPSARCFLKNPVPQPSTNGTCPTNADCISGYKEPSWCGDKGQGDVLSCPSGTCNARSSKSCTGWWIFRQCTTLVSANYYCQ